MSELSLQRVQIGCDLCKAIKDFEKAVPMISAFEFGLVIGVNLLHAPDPVNVCERHELIVKIKQSLQESQCKSTEK